MNTKTEAGKPANSNTGTATGGIVLALFGALFVGGVALAWMLTGGEGLPIAPTESIAAESTAAETLAGETSPPASETDPDIDETPDLAAANVLDTAALHALEQKLTDAQSQIQALTTRTDGYGHVEERLAAVERRVARAEERAAEAADALSHQSALLSDYAELGASFSPDGMLVRLDETLIRFPAGGAEMPANADAALSTLARFLTRHPDQIARVRGHTDSSGSAEANQTLSARRAEAVRGALMDLGVPAERLQVEGIGADEPIADNGSSDGRRRNRRVDVLLQQFNDV